MILELKKWVSKGTIVLDNYIDSNGDIHYQWAAVVNGEHHKCTGAFDTFDACFRDMIEHLQASEIPENFAGGKNDPNLRRKV